MPSIAAPTNTMHAALHALSTRERLAHAMHRADARRVEYEQKRDRGRALATRAETVADRERYLRAASTMQRLAIHHMCRANHLINCHQALTVYGDLGPLVILRHRTTASRLASD